MINITHRCFFRCRTCESWKIKVEKGEPLALSHYKQFFKGISKINDKGSVVSFTGGEPLLKEITFDLVKLSKEGSNLTTINTNGWLLDEAKIERLIDSGIDNIVFSIDGSTPEIHDKIRGMKGSFSRIMDAAMKARKYSDATGKVVGIAACSVISALNIHDAENLAKLVKDSRYLDVIWFQAVSPVLYRGDICLGIVNQGSDKGKDWFDLAEYKDLWPREKSQIIRTFDRLIELKRSGYPINNIPSRLEMQKNYFLYPRRRIHDCICTMFKDIVLDTNGDVFHCSVKDRKIGNIKIDPIEDMWNNSRGRLCKEDVVDCTETCHTMLNCGLPKDIRLREAWKDGNC